MLLLSSTLSRTIEIRAAKVPRAFSGRGVYFVGDGEVGCGKYTSHLLTESMVRLHTAIGLLCCKMDNCSGGTIKYARTCAGLK